MTILINQRLAKRLFHLDSHEIQVEASTVREAIVKLGEIVPEYSKLIVDGKLRRTYLCHLNDVDIDGTGRFAYSSPSK